MNHSKYGANLYKDLMNLVRNCEEGIFYYNDIQLDDKTYRMFGYRIARYSDFLLPGAMECRGHMFDITDPLPQLVCLQLTKFFNLNENPFTTGWDLSQIKEITEKMDGSLISSYYHNNTLRLKTKGSLTSSQCIDAAAWLINHPELRRLVDYLTYVGNTVNMEWTSPTNRIVVGYQKPALTILNVRNVINGVTAVKEDLWKVWPVLEKYWVKSHKELDYEDVKNMEGIEGFVLEMQDGRKAKLKTDWYVALHKTKESVENDKKLFEVIMKNGQDDLRAMFSNDPYVLGKIKALEDHVLPPFRSTVKKVEEFFNENKGLLRKDFAIKAQSTLGPSLMALAMNKYLEREVDYEAHAIKWAENYLEGFKYELPKEENVA